MEPGSEAPPGFWARWRVRILEAGAVAAALAAIWGLYTRVFRDDEPPTTRDGDIVAATVERAPEPGMGVVSFRVETTGYKGATLRATASVHESGGMPVDAGAGPVVDRIRPVGDTTKETRKLSVRLPGREDAPR